VYYIARPTRKDADLGLIKKSKLFKSEGSVGSYLFNESKLLPRRFSAVSQTNQGNIPIPSPHVKCLGKKMHYKLLL
jgi:hypothetical protein